MGKYSDSGDEKKKSKKKKKKRGRSRSSSSESSYSSLRHSKKSKKSKKKGYRSRSYSRSVSPARRRRSRSRSRDSYRRRRSYSRSRSKSRSKEYSRRRSRSYSRDSRSRSRSRDRYRRSRSGDRRRRSRSRSKDRSRRSSRSPEKVESNPLESVPGFDKMNPLQQAEVRMQLALKAAADASEKLKSQGLLPHDTPTTNFEMSKAIEEIEKDGFRQKSFNSKKQDSKGKKEPSRHDTAMFGKIGGDGDSLTPSWKPTSASNGSGASADTTDSLLHPSLIESYEVKMEKWIRKLTEMRRKKLEGEVMV